MAKHLCAAIDEFKKKMNAAQAPSSPGGVSPAQLNNAVRQAQQGTLTALRKYPQAYLGRKTGIIK